MDQALFDATVMVVIPTVPARAAECARTVALWRAQGVTPTVLECTRVIYWQPPGPVAHGLLGQFVAKTALREGRTLVWCEDDVEIDARLVAWLCDLTPTLDQAVTLYVPSYRFLRSETRGLSAEAWPPRLFPVRSFADWWGSQALVLPPTVCEAIVQRCPVERNGFDIMVRETLRAMGQRLLVAVPNPVDHRSPPSVTSPRYRPHHSPLCTVRCAERST